MKKFILAFACLFLAIPCQAINIIIVLLGGKIQSAIDYAEGGDMVIVLDGIYTGIGNRDIDFKGKAITVQSANGPENCIIDCDGMGRGFYFHSGEGGNSVVSGLTITNGIAYIGGGIYCNNSSPTVQNNIITGNYAPWDGVEIPGFGGGIYCQNSSAIITGNVIINNSADGLGGGLYSSSSSLILNNNIFGFNIAYSVGGFFPSPGNGGGICCSSSSLMITNNTITRNQAKDLWLGIPGEGGGIRCSSSHVILVNTIVWNNLLGGEIVNYASMIDVTYSNILGGWPGTGNIEADPLFAALGDGDYHLKSQAGRWEPSSQSWVQDAVTSPCIDAGDPASNWTAELWPHGKRINMGAYGGTPQASMSLSNVGNIADLDNDDSVDYDDLRLFTGKWLNQQVLLKEDLDRNGFVDFIDFAVFAENWLWQ